ncbi:hypothetical protein EBT31_06175 [bacterium]|nr:hypothetical protein [bacterium]
MDPLFRAGMLDSIKEALSPELLERAANEALRRASVLESTHDRINRFHKADPNADILWREYIRKGDQAHNFALSALNKSQGLPTTTRPLHENDKYYSKKELQHFRKAVSGAVQEWKDGPTDAMRSIMQSPIPPQDPTRDLMRENLASAQRMLAEQQAISANRTALSKLKQTAKDALDVAAQKRSRNNKILAGLGVTGALGLGAYGIHRALEARKARAQANAPKTE